ncbi:MAG: RNA polymerase sigma factor [Lachnospiraceae bacterium]|nr:RNA polymerase sigma factor [Lachnospiraceae bacterium]
MERIDSKETLIRLINRYQNLVFSVCLKMTGDYFVAEDLTQETFLAAYKHLDQCSVDAEKAWLCRIASNKCIDYCRAAARRAVPTEDEEIHSLELPDKEEPLRQVLNSEILEELRSCCNALPPPYREVAIAHFMDGKTAKEIAEGSQAGINTVKTHIRRAREMLKKTYRKELLQE